MISSFGSDRPTFKRFRFRKGLNIVVASRIGQQHDASASDRGRTRNGAGKSSFVDILRFMLGGEVQKQKTIVAAPAIKDDVFDLTLELLGKPVTIKRSPSGRGKITVIGEFADWPVQPDVNKKTGEVTMSVHSWTDLLGRCFFDLPAASQLTNTGLSFSALISYFLRRSRDGGFGHWTQTHKSQSLNRVAIPLSYIFGLDTEIARRFLRADESAKAAQELRRAISQGMLAAAVGTSGQIRGQALKARRRLEKLQNRLEGREVLDFYGAYEREAAELDSQVRSLNDENYTDQQLILDLENATKSEEAPEIPDLDRLYKEATVVLPDVSLRKYDEVRAFHDQVIENRRMHLNAEINAAQIRIQARTAKRDRQMRRHDEILGLLDSGVSSSHFRKLERELIEAEAESRDLSKRLELAERIEQSRVDVKSQRVDAERALLQDLIERRPIIDEAVEIFMDVSSALYEKPATLEFRASANGIRFIIERPDLPSEGVSQMQIFTFDITLATLCARRGKWPGFLVHDSHIFDGVDGRQIGSALEVANQKMNQINGQYIVTMNSDELEKVHSESGVDFSSFIVQPVLDDSETGGLFGFRFDYDMSDAILDSAEGQS